MLYLQFNLFPCRANLPEFLVVEGGLVGFLSSGRILEDVFSGSGIPRGVTRSSREGGGDPLVPGFGGHDDLVVPRLLLTQKVLGDTEVVHHLQSINQSINQTLCTEILFNYLGCTEYWLIRLQFLPDSGYLAKNDFFLCKKIESFSSYNFLLEEKNSCHCSHISIIHIRFVYRISGIRPAGNPGVLGAYLSYTEERGNNNHPAGTSLEESAGTFVLVDLPEGQGQLITFISLLR